MNQHQINKIKAKLEEIDNFEDRRSDFKVQDSLVQKGRQSSGYFLKLEARKKLRKSVNMLQRSDRT